MKTLITATTLTLLAGTVSAGSWEDAWKNPDLDPRYSPRSANVTEPMTGGPEFAVSLYEFTEGSADGYQGAIEGYKSMGHSGIASTSLDEFNRGNPDHDRVLDLSLPGIGVDRAVAGTQ